MNLQQKQAPSLKQTQRLMMTAQMQQAIALLQLPALELAALIETELEQNPVLEHARDEDANDPELASIEQEAAEASDDVNMKPEKELSFDEKDFEIMRRLDEEFRDYIFEGTTGSIRRTAEQDKLLTYQESSICAESTLFEHLMRQAAETFDTPEEMAIAEALIGNFDERGYLTTPLEEVMLLNNIDKKKLLSVLGEIQRFEPYGVGARNVQESLLIQLRALAKKHTLAYAIVESHYDDLIHNRMPSIQKGLKCSYPEIQEAIDRHISKLDLHPGTLHSLQPVQNITPDVLIKEEGDHLTVEINNDHLPSLRFNSRYMRMLDDETLPEEAKEFIRRKLMSAKWMMRNVHQRNETIEKIAQSLAKRQYAFFSDPAGQLVPLTMKTVAEELDLHESTIARAVANKYVDSPRGLLPLRSFFTNTYVSDQGEDLSSKTVRDMIADLIHNEDKRKPLSDEVLSKLIKERGIPCARRTVAKYRTLLNLGNAQQRRLF